MAWRGALFTIHYSQFVQRNGLKQFTRLVGRQYLSLVFPHYLLVVVIVADGEGFGGSFLQKLREVIDRGEPAGITAGIRTGFT